MRLNELRDTSYEIAKSKGWHDPDLKRSFADLMALVISELAEALEEHRAQRPMVYFGPEIRTGYDYRDALALAGKGNKPEGVAVELADAAIRIGDCAGAYGLSLEGIPGCGDTVASLRHSDLVSHESFGAWMCEACLPLCELGVVPHEEHGNPRADMLAQSLCAIRGMAHWLGITGNELERAIEIKHAYNRTRSHRHGNKLL